MCLCKFFFVILVIYDIAGFQKLVVASIDPPLVINGHLEIILDKLSKLFISKKYLNSLTNILIMMTIF